MAVEYTQGLFVADTSWRPSWRHVEQVDAVLIRWGFRRIESPYYAELRAGSEVPRAQTTTPPAPLGGQVHAPT